MLTMGFYLHSWKACAEGNLIAYLRGMFQNGIISFLEMFLKNVNFFY